MALLTCGNDKFIAEYNPEKKDIFLRDLVDFNNQPAAYNTTKRGIEKAWSALVLAVTPSMTMHQACDILWDLGIHTHYWCMVD